MPPLSKTPLFAFWPFMSGWMLLWGLAAAIPIVIHLWSRRRYREMSWAAMEFLLAALRKNSRRIWVEQLLLLATRVLILLLLALALANPLLDGVLKFGGAGAGETHYVVVVDGSFSMDYRPPGNAKSLFEMAQDAVEKLARQCTQGDGFTLVLMSDPPQTVIAQPTFDADAFIDELRRLRLPHAGGNLDGTLGAVETIVRGSAGANRLTKQRVLFFTDLGRTTWDDALDGGLRTRVAKLAESAQLSIVDLGQAGASNLAVTRLLAKEPLATAGRDLHVEAELQAFGGHAFAGVKLELHADGQLVDQRTVDVPAAGRLTQAFTHRFDSPGEHSLLVTARDDELRIDNRRWLSVPVQEAIRVLCVQGQPDEAKLVALALEPTRDERPRVQTQIVAENALLETRLHDFDAVVLCNVGRFSRDEANVLYEYVARGGGLIVFPGDQTLAESYNAELGGELSARRLLPAKFEQLATGGTGQMNPLQYRHPIVAPFRDQPRAGLLTVPVWKYFRMTPFDREQTKIALALDNGDPLIVEERIGRGRVVQFATAGSTVSLDRTVNPPSPWTALPTWPSFVPLMQETLSLVLTDRVAARNVLVGESLLGSPQDNRRDESSRELAAPSTGSAITVAGPETPEGIFPTGERVRPADNADDHRWSFSETWFSGLYRAEQAAGSNGAHSLFAVNIDPRESNLDRIDRDQLPAQFNASAADSPTPTTLPTSPRRPLFRYLLSAVFVLLVAESWMAWYFGHRGTAT